MASTTITAQYTTVSIGIVADDVTTRGNWVRCKNLGANPVSYSEIATPASGAAAAGSQSTLIPAGAGGKADEVYLPPNQKTFFKAATGATLLAFEEIFNLPQRSVA